MMQKRGNIFQVLLFEYDGSKKTFHYNITLLHKTDIMVVKRVYMSTILIDKETGRLINNGIEKMFPRYIDEKTFELEAVPKDKKANCELVRVKFRFFFNENNVDEDSISSGWWAHDSESKMLIKM